MSNRNTIATPSAAEPETSSDRPAAELELYKAALAQANLNYQEKVEELSLVRRLTEALRYIPDSKKVCQLILEALAEQFAAPNACLGVYHEQSSRPILVVSTGTPACQKVLDEGAHRWHRYTASRRRPTRSGNRFAPSRSNQASWVHFQVPAEKGSDPSALYVPIQVQGSLLGIFYFELTDIDQLHSGEERVFSIVSELVASILLNVRLYYELAQYSHILEKRTRMLEEMNQRLTRTQAQLVHSEKLAAIGLFAGGIAHEMNNPLMGISGHLELLAEEYQDNPELVERLEVVRKLSDRCSRILRGVLDFARYSPDEWSHIDINEALQELLTLIEPQLRRQGIEVQTDLSAKLPCVTGNRSRLQQVFLNIISNAQKAMPGGGVLRLTTSVGAEEPQRIVVAFSDTGCGISGETLSKVFDPFFTTAEVGKGTGLGLAISFGIIKEHGGDILVESEPGHGATFKVVLPAGKAGEP